MIRRNILSVVLLLVVSMAAQAQRVISRIQVRGNVPASIVVPQTALIEGRAYTDADLDVAIARIRRLPFVYDARYSVEGDALVIEVTGETRLFYDIEAIGARTRFDDFNTAQLSGGGRMFAGSGVVQATVTKVLADGDDARLGGLEYAHYGIGGTRFFASASVDVALSSSSSFDPDPTWQLTVGYPLTVAQTLTASARKSGFNAQRFLTGLPRPLEAHQELETFNIRWAYDTTEDPLFARRGMGFSVSPSLTRDNSLFESGTIIPPAPPVITSFRRDGTSLALSVNASKIWPVFARGAIFSGVDATTENAEADSQLNDDFVQPVERNEHAARLSVGYGHNFFDLSAAPDGVRQRMELAFTVSRSQSSQNGISSTLNEQSAELAYVFRHRVGSVRASFAYAFD